MTFDLVAPTAAATATTTAAAISTTTATTAAAISTTAAAATAAAALFARACFIYGEVAAVHILAAQLGNRGLRAFRRGHGNKREPARASRCAVGYDIHFRDRAGGREKVLEIQFRGVEGKVSDEQFSIHDDLLRLISLFPDCSR
jgi:hypothetical protein